MDGQPEAVRQTAALVRRLAEEKETTREAIVLAWPMRHPAGIQPVSRGSMVNGLDREPSGTDLST
ncbi:hypothetical protein LJK88_41895 [Paenibacillus sp. P26]|nr:hypothetical protein LJK88_41895 [Paenibacillus sp. P26]UUZ92663.1 hypothetical protein LJK87_46410 [Paenibacillus sp. P25]